MDTLTLTLTLVLRFYDMAGVSPREVAHAQQAVTAVLGSAHIRVSWVSCNRVPAGRPLDDRCDNPQPADLVVRVAHARRGATALGDAYVDTGRVNSLATIYLERVRDLAGAAGTDPGTLMGRAIAHEIGHLVFGTSAHSTQGLMRAQWSEEALRRDSPRAWIFSAEEAEMLRAKLHDRTVPGPISMPAGDRAMIEWPLNPHPCGPRLAATCIGEAASATARELGHRVN